MSWLITRPKHDYGTKYLHAWSEVLVTKAKELGLTTHDLSARAANRKTMLACLAKRGVGLVFFNGHGLDDRIGGWQNEVLVDNARKRVKIPGIVVARCCRAGKVLGRFMVKNGTQAFIGYKDDYVIKTSTRYKANPLADKTAALYLKPSNLIGELLLSGKSAREAHTQARKMLLENLREVLAGKDPENMDTARWLWHDWKNQVLRGKGKTTFKGG